LTDTKFRQRCRGGAGGFSLIELMVAITLALIITAAIVAVFSSTRTTYQLDEGLARLQENARFAMETITRETRQAAAMGCKRWREDVSGSGMKERPFNNLKGAAGGGAYDFGEMLLGFEATSTAPGNTRVYSGSFPADATGDWTPALNTNLVANAMPGSDILVVRRMSSAPARLTGAYVTDDTVFLEPAAVNRFKKDDVVMVYDCAKASIFQVTSVVNGTELKHDGSGNNPGNDCTNWFTGGAPPCKFGGSEAQAYDESAEAAAVQTSAFYVARGASGIPALFQATYPGGALEMAEGVENMQVLYGIDDNGDGRVDRYDTADKVTSWGGVVAARVSLLVSTVNTSGTSADVGADTNTYLLLGSDTATAVTIDPPDDNRRRRVFESTIVLRSRGF
jgi:type IV pilus assembly protein PilW